MAHVAHAEHAWASVEQLHALELARRGGAAAAAASASSSSFAAAVAAAEDAATARWHAHSRRCVARRRFAAAAGPLLSFSPTPHRRHPPLSLSLPLYPPPQ